MPASPCEATVRVRGDAAVIDLSGDIDARAGATLERAYDEADAAGVDRIVLGFSAVAYINSTGIALVVGLLARARADDRPLSAFGLSEHYREIFAITRLTDFVRIADDEPAALAAAAPA